MKPNIQPSDMIEGRTYAFVYMSSDSIITSISRLTTKTSVSYVFNDVWSPEASEPWYTETWNIPITVIEKLTHIYEIKEEDIKHGV